MTDKQEDNIQKDRHEGFNQDRLTDLDSWFRGLFMLGFSALLYIVVAPVIFVLMIAQFIFHLVNGAVNENLKDFSAVVVEYVAQVLRFISFESDEKPFPFAPLPQTPNSSEAAAESQVETETETETDQKPEATVEVNSAKAGSGAAEGTKSLHVEVETAETSNSGAANTPVVTSEQAPQDSQEPPQEPSQENPKKAPSDEAPKEPPSAI